MNDRGQPLLSTAVPVASILLATFVAALPWGVGSEFRFFLPSFIYLVIHYWTLRYPDRVPVSVIFAAGLTFDVMTGGPLGYWSLVFLAGYVVALLQIPWIEGGRPMRWALVFAALLAVAIFEWALASIYYLDWADWHPYLLAAVVIGVMYPLVALVLQLVSISRAPASTGGFERGG